MKWHAILTEMAYCKEGQEVLTYVVTIPPVSHETHCNKLKSEIYHKVHEVSCKNLNGHEILIT